MVQGLENEIRHLVERIKCQIEQKRVWKCLDDAFCEVRDEIKCCPTQDLCCEDPCEFPLEDIENKTVAELAVLIAEYQERTDAAKQCFTDLKGEPAALKQRVEDAKTEVASLTTDLGGDPATLDLKRLYARALVVQWKIKKVWGAFGQVQKFVDCLCQALTCWTKGCQAVYQLSGAKAIAECKEKAKTGPLRQAPQRDRRAGAGRVRPDLRRAGVQGRTLRRRRLETRTRSIPRPTTRTTRTVTATSTITTTAAATITTSTARARAARTAAATDATRPVVHDRRSPQFLLSWPESIAAACDHGRPCRRHSVVILP